MPGCEEGIGIKKRGGHRAFWQRFSDLMATFKLPLSELFEVRDGALFTSDFSVPDTVPGAMSVLIRDLENWTEPIYCPFSLASARTRKEAKPPYCLFTHWQKPILISTLSFYLVHWTTGENHTRRRVVNTNPPDTPRTSTLPGRILLCFSGQRAVPFPQQAL